MVSGGVWEEGRKGGEGKGRELRTGPSAIVFSGFWKDILSGGLGYTGRAEEAEEDLSANHDLNGEVR